MQAIDTNVVVRLAVRDDETQYAQALEAIKGGAWVSHVVLFEALWVLRKLFDADDKKIEQVVRLLLTNDSIVLENKATVEEALHELAENPKLGFADCFILAIARQAKRLPLRTFDKALSKLRDVQRIQ